MLTKIAGNQNQCYRSR